MGRMSLKNLIEELEQLQYHRAEEIGDSNELEDDVIYSWLQDLIDDLKENEIES